ncbi:MAG: class II fructose-bisphosphate aldolase [Planctomycetes bacterium]|nr:class II fructose-bisphosphate aldolase [Planctomycetota bacterium]
MLENFNAMLADAYGDGYAVGSFNVYSYETMKGAILAARRLGQPVIVAFGAKYLANMSLADAVGMADRLGSEYGVRVCLHLDHCPDLTTVFAAIRAGFSSVMYDGSALPFADNAANTALVCRVAHACGVSVEAELGSLAATETSHEGSADDREVYTSPEAAREFMARTDCDALAVSVGTVHGLYHGTPHIRIDILQRINALVGKPLVLHGGSGIPEAVIRECIANGIAKINVNTEISTYTIEKTKELLAAAKPPHLATLAEKQQGFVGEIVEKYMRFFMNN